MCVWGGGGGCSHLSLDPQRITSSFPVDTDIQHGDIKGILQRVEVNAATGTLNVHVAAFAISTPTKMRFSQYNTFYKNSVMEIKIYMERKC